MAMQFKTFANSVSESKPAEVFEAPEKKEAFRNAMKESARRVRLNKIKAMESAKKVWVGR